MSLIVPAEWAPHRAMWLGFPSHEELWVDNLEVAQGEVAALARALAGPGREHVRLMTGSPQGEADARHLLGDVTGIEIVPGRFGDIWLRDTGPIFAQGPEGGLHAIGFQFNGWGEKFLMDHDDEVAAQIATAAGLPLTPCDFVMAAMRFKKASRQCYQSSRERDEKRRQAGLCRCGMPASSIRVMALESA